MDREIRIQKLKGKGWSIMIFSGKQFINLDNEIYPDSTAAINRAFDLSANYEQHGLKTHIQINCKEAGI
jgi:hypothetical protein